MAGIQGWNPEVLLRRDKNRAEEALRATLEAWVAGTVPGKTWSSAIS